MVHLALDNTPLVSSKTNDIQYNSGFGRQGLAEPLFREAGNHVVYKFKLRGYRTDNLINFINLTPCTIKI